MASYGSERSFVLQFCARDDLVFWKSDAWKCQNQVTLLTLTSWVKAAGPFVSCLVIKCIKNVPKWKHLTLGCFVTMQCFWRMRRTCTLALAYALAIWVSHMKPVKTNELQATSDSLQHDRHHLRAPSRPPSTSCRWKDSPQPPCSCKQSAATLFSNSVVQYLAIEANSFPHLPAYNIVLDLNNQIVVHLVQLHALVDESSRHGDAGLHLGKLVLAQRRSQHRLKLIWTF